MPKIIIKSDGCPASTQVTVDGTNLTDEDNVVAMDFHASVRYEDYVTFSYTTRVQAEDGSIELTSYQFISPIDTDDEPTIRKVKRGLGRTEDEAEDEAALRSSSRTIGDELNRIVIDRKHIDPRLATAVKEVTKGRRVTIRDEADNDGDSDEEGDSG